METGATANRERLERPLQPSLPLPGDPTVGGEQRYTELRDYIIEIRDRLLRSGELPGPARGVALVEPLAASPALVEAMLPLTLLYGHGEDMFIDHAVNNLIYSLKLGLRMGYSPERQIGLGMAALHHDIGMFLLPDSILRKKTRLTPSELAEVQKHPGRGSRLLEAYDTVDPGISRAVLEHHERESGQGYPEGIRNGEIGEYAKIIGICDSYEAMTHDRPHKKAMEQYVSVLELAGTKVLYFDPRIVKIFLDAISLYPVGSHVRLNNGAIGVVVSTNPGNPFKPAIRILKDGQGARKANDNVLDLAQTNILHIVTGVPADEATA